jgi:hypothetical protein
MNGITIVALPIGDKIITYRDGDTAPAHQTLVYMGDVNESSEEEKEHLIRILNDLTKGIPPILAKVAGTAILGPDHEPVALTETKELVSLRNHLIEDPMVMEMMSRAVQFPNYVSHVTGLDHLMYGDSILFDRVALWFGQQRYVLPLLGYFLPE